MRVKMDKNMSQTVRSVRQRHQNDSIDTKDFIARPYQVELYEICKSRNTIVCLNTGGGKTFIAVMLIKHLSPQLHDLSETQTQGFNGKRTFFLVPTTPLVSQQANVIRDHTDLTVGEYHGRAYDDWTKDEWNKEFNKYKVLVMIDEIFRQILYQGIISLSQINLIVFDEAHSAVQNHPSREIMRVFDSCPLQNHPKILGLSASLIMKHTSPAGLEKLIRKLEKTLRSTCETATDLRTINKYAAKPIEKVVYYETFKMSITNDIKSIKYHADDIRTFIDDINSDSMAPQKNTINLKSLDKSIQDVLYILGTMGVWCAMKVASFYIRELSDTVEIYHSSKSHYTAFLSAVLTSLNVIKVTLSKLLNGFDDSEKLLKLTSPKLLELANCLSQYKPDNNIGSSINLCGIIFAERRSVARILCIWLQELAKCQPNDYGFIKVDYVLGHGGRLMTSKKQEESLKKFRSHECNLLVSTSVLEEGLDVPRCNLVVRYDPPKQFREYIQSKGRARAEKGKYIILVESIKKDIFDDNLNKYKETEDILTKTLHKRSTPTEDEIEDSLDDQLLPPYIPNKSEGSARVTLNSAIAVVNRYCLKLPSDSFTKLTPQFKIDVQDSGQYTCRLRLPINSQIRHEITGVSMPNKRTAKKAAALKVCEVLHKAGELDDSFLPVGKETIKFIDELGLEPPDDELEKVDRGPRPGTTKRRQYYNKLVANVLNHCPIKSGIDCYLYVFSMRLNSPIPEEQNTRGRKIEDPADSARNFGIITTQRVPPICDFPVFTRSGEVTVKFLPVLENIRLSNDQIEELSIFHNFTFAEVLRLIKYPLKFDPNNSNSSYFVVPINQTDGSDKCDIDWNFVHSIKKHKESPHEILSEDERKNFVFNGEKYKDAVVYPWYRKDKPLFFFYVAEICDNLTPKSPFPDEGYETFEKYYYSKYNIAIMNASQPLLDVDHTSARLNLLTPRYVNRKGISLPTSTAKTKKEKRENLQQKQILVPELCTIHPFPASIWRKAVCLPCMLYRLNSLLVAEQLRRKVANETGIGIVEIESDMCWSPLDFGWTLSNIDSQNIEHCNDSKGVEIGNDLRDDMHEIWDFDNVETLAIENKENLSDNRNCANSEDNQTEFVIDTFDPNKYEIRDDDFDDDIFDYGLEDDDELEIMDWTEQPINIIGGPNGFSSTSVPVNWGLNSSVQLREITNDDSGEAVNQNELIRYGSPSSFPNTTREWEFNSLSKTSVYPIVPGLEVISTSGELNIDGLAKDLECFPVEAFDSFDEGSDYDECYSDDDDDEYDDMINSNQNKSSNTARTYTNKSRISDILRYELLNDLPHYSDQSIDSDEKSIRKLYKYICAEESQVQNINNQTENLNIDSNETVVSVKDKVQETVSNNSECNKNDLVELFKSYLEENDDLLEEFDTSDDESEAIPDEIDETNDGLKLASDVNSNQKETKAHDVDSVCFGDLLPDRENNQSKEPFNIRFDPLKSENNKLGPSPSMILQALTMSNASDGINLERLETVGDSFLKYAVTAFLYCVCPSIHEGKLSYLRSRQISNMNLYRLGKKIGIAEFMCATKFEPNDNWCPPCYKIPDGLEEALIESNSETKISTIYDIGIIDGLNDQQIMDKIRTHKSQTSMSNNELKQKKNPSHDLLAIPYNLLTQHSIPDKSIADCVEALIGAYLISSGPRGALLFMKWLDLKVMPKIEVNNENADDLVWHWLPKPKSPLLVSQDDSFSAEQNLIEAQKQLNSLYTGHNFSLFEDKLGYYFRDKAYLIQAFTHNSYYENQVTDCYQRLEFLGDAVLDFLITRYLYEDPVGHSPGTLTDLRSALVNNTFFASLSVKYEFYKHLKMLSFDLFRVVNAFVNKFNASHERSNDYNLFIAEGESENAEDIEVPKALGDVFESVAGAIYLDSDMSLDAVWNVYFKMMKPEIEYFSTHVPKSPIRELLEMEPQNAKFGKPELISGRKIRVCVEVFDEGKFFGIGRNKRIAKCTAAKRALRALKSKRNSVK